MIIESITQFKYVVYVVTAKDLSAHISLNSCGLFSYNLREMEVFSSLLLRRFPLCLY